MAISLIDSVSASGVNGATTSAIDTTGADLIAIGVSYYLGSSAPTDSKSNSWTALTKRGDAHGCIIYYCISPTVGTGHTFSFSESFSYAVISVAAYSGVASFASESAGGSGTSTTIQPGSITPSIDGSLLFTVIEHSASGNPTITGIDSSFTIRQNTAASSGVNIGGAVADLVQSTAAAVNPTWSISSSVALCSSMAAFDPSGVSTGPTIHQGLSRIKFGAVRSLHAIEIGVA